MTPGALATQRRREVLQAVWRAGALSVSELHELSGRRPNTIGADLRALAREGFLRQRPAKARGRGRPRLPMEIDPLRRSVVGLAIQRGRVEAAEINLLGQLKGPASSAAAANPGEVVAAARVLLGRHVTDDTLAVGLSTPGFVDPATRSTSFNPALSGRGRIDLAAIYESAGPVPVILENDMHALAARWLLSRRADPGGDVLLVHFDDGELGAALLVGGQPNRGCIKGANELGHSRFPVKTDECFCGRTGCLERISSTRHLRRLGGRSGTMAERAQRFAADDKALVEVIGYLALGIGNAVNFTRVGGLVIVSRLLRYAAFADALLGAVRGEILDEILRHVRIDVWDEPALRVAETAGWLALASVYCDGWVEPHERDPLERATAGAGGPRKRRSRSAGRPSSTSATAPAPSRPSRA